MSSIPEPASYAIAGSGTLPASGPAAEPAAAARTGITASGGGLQRLVQAIDELARAAPAGPRTEASASDLAERLAAIWAMVADLDPGVAARLSGYLE